MQIKIMKQQAWKFLACRRILNFFQKLLFLTRLFIELQVQYITGLSSLGVLGVPWHPQILADQLTLSQPGGEDYAHCITTGTPGFSDLPTALYENYKFRTYCVHKLFWIVKTENNLSTQQVLSL